MLLRANYPATPPGLLPFTIALIAPPPPPPLEHRPAQYERCLLDDVSSPLCEEISGKLRRARSTRPCSRAHRSSVLSSLWTEKHAVRTCLDSRNLLFNFDGPGSMAHHPSSGWGEQKGHCHHPWRLSTQGEAWLQATDPHACFGNCEQTGNHVNDSV